MGTISESRTDRVLPDWVGNTIGVVLGSAVIAVAIAAWNDSRDDAVLRERLRQLESSFEEFRRPGDRYTAADGARDRAALQYLRKDCETTQARLQAGIKELSGEFATFRRDAIVLQAQIDQIPATLAEIGRRIETVDAEAAHSRSLCLYHIQAHMSSDTPNTTQRPKDRDQ